MAVLPAPRRIEWIRGVRGLTAGEDFGRWKVFNDGMFVGPSMRRSDLQKATLPGTAVIRRPAWSGAAVFIQVESFTTKSPHSSSQSSGQRFFATTLIENRSKCAA